MCDIVLCNLLKLWCGKFDFGCMMMYNLFINSVDLYELFVGVYIDYLLVCNMFGGMDLIIFYCDLICKVVVDFEEIGFVVFENCVLYLCISVKVELCVIEYEIELMCKKNFVVINVEVYVVVFVMFWCIWSVMCLIDWMCCNLLGYVDL